MTYKAKVAVCYEISRKTFKAKRVSCRIFEC